MKQYRLPVLLIIVMLCFATGPLSAQDATPQPSVARPALIPCVQGENIPCVQNVEEIATIVGTWRSYFRDNRGVHFGFTTFNQDGTVAVATNLQATPTLVGTITFTRGIANVTPDTNAAGVSNCVAAGPHEMRLLRMGDQPIAVTYHSVLPTADVCFGRVGGYVQPMLYYSGTGEELYPLSTSSDALTQSLVPCSAVPRPCDIIATSLDDIIGFWKTYFTAIPEGFGFQRNDDSGGQMMVGSGGELSALKEFFPAPFTQRFIGPLFVGGEPSASDDCAGSLDFLRVIKFGDQPIAQVTTAVQDKCPPRNDSFSDAMIWVAGL